MRWTGAFVTIIIVILMCGFGAILLNKLEYVIYEEVFHEVYDELLGISNETPQIFYTDFKPVKEGSDVVSARSITSAQEATLERNIDYTINYETGMVNITNVPFTSGTTIEIYIDYEYPIDEPTKYTEIVDYGNEGLNIITEYSIILCLVVVMIIIIGIITYFKTMR